MLDLDRISDQAPPAMGKSLDLLERLKAAGEPISISINGQISLPIRDDGAFQLLFSPLERLEVAEMLRERLAELDAGGPTFSMEEVKEMFGAKHGISV